MSKASEILKGCVFYGILDTGYVAREDMKLKCRALIDGGAGIIQLRAKRESTKQRTEIALEIAPLFERENAPIFIIDDDIDLAKSISFAGLHIGQDDTPAAEAREILGEGRIIGLSTHSPEQASAADKMAGIIDYFAVGPVYATQTKPGRKPVGLELVSYASKMKARLPWFAIGGVNLKTAKAVRDAGAERIVAVSDVLKPADTANAVRELIAEFLKA